MVFAMSHWWRRNLESVRIGPFWPGGMWPATPMLMSSLVALSLTFVLLCLTRSNLPIRLCVYFPSGRLLNRRSTPEICMNWNAVFVTLFGRAGIYWIPDRIAIAWFSLSILSIGIISTRQIWQSVFLCHRWASAIDLLYSCVSPSILHEFGTHDSHRSIFQLLTFLCVSLSIGWILCILLSAHFNTFLYARLKCSLLAIFFVNARRQNW